MFQRGIRNSRLPQFSSLSATDSHFVQFPIPASELESLRFSRSVSMLHFVHRHYLRHICTHSPFPCPIGSFAEVHEGSRNP